MSILDTFFILFESDTSGLDRGLREAEGRAGDLTQGLQGVDAAAGNMASSMRAGMVALAGAALAAISITAMSRAMFDAVAQADDLNLAVSRLGLNIESVSMWGDLIKKNGGSVEGFIGSLEGLNSQLLQMDVTGRSKAAPFLRELGIDLTLAANKGKTAMDFLLPIADAFEGMDKQKSMAMGKRLGFDQATIMTLQSGRRAVEELLEKEKELGVITQKQGELADEFGDSMDDLKHSFRSIWLNVSEFVLPPLTWVMEKFTAVTTFMRKHGRFAQGVLIALGTAVTIFLLPPLISAATAVWAMIAPFALVGAAVIAVGLAFALLYDDVMTFLDGGDSLIGQLSEKWPIIGEVVRQIAAEFKFLWDTASAVMRFLINVWDDPKAAFEQFAQDMAGNIDALLEHFPLIKMAVQAIGDTFRAVGETTMSIWNKIVAVIEATVAAITKAIGTVLNAYDKAKSLVSSKDGAISLLSSPYSAGLSIGKKLLNAATNSPLAGQTSGSISNRTMSKNNTVNIAKVEVATQATDAQGISKAIGNSMQAQMRQAVSNFDDGVLN